MVLILQMYFSVSTVDVCQEDGQCATFMLIGTDMLQHILPIVEARLLLTVGNAHSSPCHMGLLKIRPVSVLYSIQSALENFGLVHN